MKNRLRVAAAIGAALFAGADVGLGQTLALSGGEVPTMDPRVWTTRITATGDGTFTLVVNLPISDALVETMAAADATKVPATAIHHRGRGRWEFVVAGNREAGANSTTLTHTVTGPADTFANSTAVAYTWTESTSEADHRVAMNGPTTRLDPSRVRLVFGAGLTVRHDDVIDFRIDETANRIFIDNDSRLRPSAIFGTLFTLKRWGDDGERTLDFLSSLEFTNDTSRILDGFLFGVTYSFNRTFAIGGGMSTRLGHELGPGFRRDATALVDALMADDTHKVAYARFAGLAANDELLDGFSLVDPRMPAEPFFPLGEVIKTSTNRSFFFGMFVPLDLVSVVRGLGE